MKRILVLLILIVCGVGIYAQDLVKPGDKPKAGLATGLDVYNDFWRKSNTDMKPRTINQGMDFFVVYNVPVENTPLSFSIGTGLSVHNLYNDCILKQDTSKVYTFVKISSLDTVKTLNYKKSKISLAYWDIPMEFRYRSKSGLTCAIGIKFGMNINAMTKYKGDDYTGMTKDNIKFKLKDLDNIVKWNYGFTARAGYKMIEFYYFYSITNIFTSGKGPEIAPMSLGLSIRPMFMEGKK